MSRRMDKFFDKIMDWFDLEEVLTDEEKTQKDFDNLLKQLQYREELAKL